jgi:RHS repeat-associated protein
LDVLHRAVGDRGPGRSGARPIAMLAVVAAIVANACGSTPPAPTAPPSAPPPSPSPSASATVADLALEACDPAGFVACQHQAAFIAMPLVGTGLALTYSSEWAPGRTDRPGWDATPLGLGGWAVDALQRYDRAAGVIISGDGSWRVAASLSLPNGETAVPSYDGRLAYVFDASGRHVRTVDAILGTTLLTFTYDPAGRLRAIDGTLSGGPVHLAVTRAADGSPTLLAAGTGPGTRVVLDSAGHLQATADPSGHGAVLVTDAHGLVTEYDDAAGGQTRYAYDDAGRLASIKDADGVVTTYARTPGAADEVKVTTALGRVSTYRAERSGDGLAQTDVAADGTATTMTTDAAGLRTVSLPDGTKLTLGTAPDPRWGAAAPIATPLSETRTDGVTVTGSVVAAVQAPTTAPLHPTAWSRTTTFAGHDWTEKLDPSTSSLVWTDPDGRIWTERYDTAGRVAGQTAPGQPALAYAYDTDGRLAGETQGSGSGAATIRYAYDAQTGDITVTQPDGSIAHLAVDATGRVAQASAPDGSTTSLLYDGLGRTVQVAPPGHPSSTLGVSGAGRQTGYLPPIVGSDASLQATAYDTDGNATTSMGLGARSIAYGYDAGGRVVSLANGQGQTTAAYDATTGLPTKAVADDGVTLATTYTDATPTGLAWSGPVTGSVTETLDPEGRMASVAVSGAAPVAYARDAAGLVTGAGDVAIARDPATGEIATETLGATKTTATYTADGRIATMTTAAGGSPVLDLRYAYDPQGRLTSLTRTPAGGPATVTTYAYDPEGRLVQVTRDGTVVERDAYDPAGNRIAAATSGAATVKATYDDRDRLLTFGSDTYAYAPTGQLTAVTAAAGSTRYTYDDLGALRSVAAPGGRAIAYLVDASGRRVGRLVDGTLVAGYLYQPDGLLAAQTDGSGAVVMSFAYDDAGHLAEVREGGTSLLVVTDRLGGPVALVDGSSGKLTEAITYDAWGRITSDTGPGTLPIGFAGGLRDPDTGLVRFGARDYDPATGRWTGPDPILYAGGDTNLYRYAGGDPVNATDPGGLASCNWSILCLPTGGPNVECFVSAGCQSGPGGGGCLGLGCGGGNPGGAGAGCWGCGIIVLPRGPLICVGIFCHNGQGREPGFCFLGACSTDPNGNFHCLAAICSSPDGCFGEYCNDGDPHLTTGDGRHVDLQAAGEFLLVTSPDRRIVVQDRMEPLRGSTSASLNTAVAASVDGDRVAVYASDARALVVGGVVERRSDLSLRLPHGGIVENHGSTTTVAWPDQSRLTVVRHGDHLDVGFNPAPGVGATLTGLLGSADGNPANDFTTRSGAVLDPSDPAFATKLYSVFGNSWRITQAESLFDYLPGQSTATFTNLSIPTAPATVAALPDAARTQAAATCAALGVTVQPALDDCILDVGLSGDPSYAASAVAFQAGTAGKPLAPAAGGPAPATSPVPSPAPSPTPLPAPSPTPSTGGALTLGTPVTGTLADPKQRIDYTFPATAGEIVYLAGGGACTDGLLWQLLPPGHGNEIAFGQTCKDLGRFVLPTAGTYTVEVYTDGTATGPYTYTVDAVPPVTVAPLTLGQPVSGQVAGIGAWHDYTFSATAGEIVYLAGGGACTDGLLWQLLPPGRGNEVAFGQTCKDLGRLVLPSAGTYTAEVYTTGTATGPYTFTVRPNQ